MIDTEDFDFIRFKLIGESIKNNQSLTDLQRNYPDRVKQIISELCSDVEKLKKSKRPIVELIADDYAASIIDAYRQQIDGLSEELKSLKKENKLLKKENKLLSGKLNFQQHRDGLIVPNKRLKKIKHLHSTLFSCGETVLKTREFEIITKYYLEDVSSAEIAETFNVSRARIDQIRRKSLKILEVCKKERLENFQIYKILVFVYINIEFKKFVVFCAEESSLLLKEIKSDLRYSEIKVEDISLSKGAYNLLIRNNINTVEEIYTFDFSKGLKSILNLGEATYTEIMEKCKTF